MNGSRVWRVWRLVALAILVTVTLTGPAWAYEPDCLSDHAQPQYAPLGSAPLARATPAQGDGAAPVGAACFAKSGSPVLWVTVAAEVRTSDDARAFLGRFGAITQLLGVKYWSTTEQKWRPLVSSANATATDGSTQPRADYSATELATGREHYYQVTDTRSGRPASYRLKLLSDRPDRLVLETANVEAIKKYGITFYAPGGLDTLYFLSARSPGVWSYYSITRVLPGNWFAAGHDKSYINRAVALYRHYVSLPTNSEPPAAP